MIETDSDWDHDEIVKSHDASANVPDAQYPVIRVECGSNEQVLNIDAYVI